MANVLTSFAGVPLPTELPENASDYVTSLPESAFIVAECVGHELRNDSRGGDALWLAFKPEPGQKADGGVPVDPDFEPNVSGDPDGQVNAVDIQLVINAALGI